VTATDVPAPWQNEVNKRYSTNVGTFETAYKHKDGRVLIIWSDVEEGDRNYEVTEEDEYALELRSAEDEIIDGAAFKSPTITKYAATAVLRERARTVGEYENPEIGFRSIDRARPATKAEIERLEDVIFEDQGPANAETLYQRSDVVIFEGYQTRTPGFGGTVAIIAWPAGKVDAYALPPTDADQPFRITATEDQLDQEADTDGEDHELYEVALRPEHVPVEIRGGELEELDNHAQDVSDHQGYHIERRRIICSCGREFEAKEPSSASSIKIRQRALKHLKEHSVTGTLTFDHHGEEREYAVLNSFDVDCSDEDWMVYVDGIAVYNEKQAPDNLTYERPGSEESSAGDSI
jgi:hypothetical protein